MKIKSIKFFNFSHFYEDFFPIEILLKIHPTFRELWRILLIGSFTILTTKWRRDDNFFFWFRKSHKYFIVESKLCYGEIFKKFTEVSKYLADSFNTFLFTQRNLVFSLFFYQFLCFGGNCQKTTSLYFF